MDRIAVDESIRTLMETDFSRSGGPGGQNVNKLNTKVTARVRLEEIRGLTEAEREQARERLGSRINSEGYLWVQAEEERTQGANREAAAARLVALVLEAAKRQRPRVPTKPTRASRERRLETKRERSRVKEERKAPDRD